MQNYNQGLVPNTSFAETQQYQKSNRAGAGAAVAQNQAQNPNVSQILKQSVKDFQDMIKMTQQERGHHP